MAGAALDKDAVRRELENILKSAGFERNARLSCFLRFVVERHLDGRDHELKESVIGTEVFGRKPDYSPKTDSIVRTEARRLRQRLGEYYEGSRTQNGVRIELPKGGYVPAISGAVDKPPKAVSGQPRGAKWRLVALACAGLTLVVIFGLTKYESRSRLRLNTRSPAYDLYLRARVLERRPSLRGVGDSIDLFQQAIAKDPSFASGHAGLASGYAARSGFDELTTAERRHLLTKGWAEVAKALRLAPQSADAYDALGMMQAREAQWAQAESSFRRALDLAPRDALWRDHFAMFLLLPLGRMDEALKQLRVAEELDPDSPVTHSLLMQPLAAAGRVEEADSHCLKAAENDQQRSVCWNRVLRRQGRDTESIRMLEANLNGHLLEEGVAQTLGVAYARAGRREDAEKMAVLAPRQSSKLQIFAALRDKHRTFEILDQMIPMGPTRLGRDFLNSPNFAFLHSDPRLKEFRRKIGLPE